MMRCGLASARRACYGRKWKNRAPLPRNGSTYRVYSDLGGANGARRERILDLPPAHLRNGVAFT